MDATTTFLADITVALIAGSAAGFLARTLRITPVVGYLLAGVAIGPFTPGYVTHDNSLSGLAELGLIFLLFSLGLGFSLRDLYDSGISVIAGNLLAMAGTAAAVWFAASRLGLVHPVTLALAFTVSSTAVGVALLQALGVIDRRAWPLGAKFADHPRPDSRHDFGGDKHTRERAQRCGRRRAAYSGRGLRSRGAGARRHAAAPAVRRHARTRGFGFTRRHLQRGGARRRMAGTFSGFDV